MARRAKESSLDKIRRNILAGKAPSGLRVPGKLSFASESALRTLPDGLAVGWLDLSECSSLSGLPAKLRVSRLTLSGSWDPTRLIGGLRCYRLDLQTTSIRELPPDLRVDYRLDLEGCRSLERLPDNLKVGCLNLRGCTALQALPEGLDCYFLDISNCTSIEGWPERASVSVGRFAARGCMHLTALPPWLNSISQLDLRDCIGIRVLPENLRVSSWIDVAGTGIRSLPHALKDVALRWRGVPVDQRIAFFPETITAKEVLAETNAEKRRILLERMGYEKFLAKTNAQMLDEDTDPGGPRRLMRVEMANDEPLVCVSLICPSTDRQYVIRVPPTVESCHEAAAWIAGFDNPDDYHPLIET